MKKYIAGLVTAIITAGVGLVIHVASQESIKSWVASHMAGHHVTPSWDVRYIALLTSLEIGIGLVILYALVREALPGKSSLVRGILLGVLLLAIMGRLIRQPLMDLIIGNPVSVVAVQDGISWVVWLAMCIVLALVYDFLAERE
jgi:uncharacterized membrane protein YkvI